MQNPQLRRVGGVAVVLFALFIVAGIEMEPEDMEMRLPNLDDPVTWFIFLVIGAIVAWSWVCCGSDHEEEDMVE